MMLPSDRRKQARPTVPSETCPELPRANRLMRIRLIERRTLSAVRGMLREVLELHRQRNETLPVAWRRAWQAVENAVPYVASGAVGRKLAQLTEASGGMVIRENGEEGGLILQALERVGRDDFRPIPGETWAVPAALVGPLGQALVHIASSTSARDEGGKAP